MSLPVYVRPEAEAELRNAHDWYEERRPGLGEEFLSCVEAAIESVRRNPELCAAVHGGVRRVLARRFPYGVYYLPEPERIVVLAVFHGHRDPAELMRRLGSDS